MRKITRILPLTAALGGSLLLSACCGNPTTTGAGSPPESTEITEAEATIPAMTATTTATASGMTAAGPAATPHTATDNPAASPGGASTAAAQPCATGDLTIAIAGEQGAAGSLIYNLGFNNAAENACTLTGFPGVSLVGEGTGTQLGAPAIREGANGATVTLNPGETGYASLRVSRAENLAPDACDLVVANGLRIYPPNQTTAAYAPVTEVSACSGSDIELLSVRPVTATAE